MLFDLIDVLMEPIIKLYRDFEEAVILDIVRRLAKMGKVTDTAAWQLNRLQQSGLAYDAAIERISKLSGLSEKELKTLFEKAGVKSVEFDDSIYRLAGLNPKQVSPAMAEVFKIGLQKTNGILRNLTRTTAMDIQNLFIDIVDTAYQEVVTGAFSYDQAIRQAVINLADKGIGAVSYVNRVDFIETAVRRAVLTGVSQTATELQLTRAREMGQDLMSVSAHIGARNKGVGPMNHESWQGQVYSISGTSDKYKPLYETTGLGTGEGLGGYNCRHSLYVFFEGLSQNAYDEATLDSYEKKTVTYQGKEISVYEATQIQRSIERQIRKWKRRESALDAAGQIYSDEGVQALNKVDYWQGVMRAFIKETGLDRQRVREQL